MEIVSIVKFAIQFVIFIDFICHYALEATIERIRW